MAAADGFVLKSKGKVHMLQFLKRVSIPIVTGAHIVTALQAIVSRNVSALQSAVISVTRYTAERLGM